MATSLKRILETNEDLSNKRVKICTEIGHFYEVQSNKNVMMLGEVEEIGEVVTKNIDQVTMVVGKKGTLLRVESEIKGKKEMA